MGSTILFSKTSLANSSPLEPRSEGSGASRAGLCTALRPRWSTDGCPPRLLRKPVWLLYSSPRPSTAGPWRLQAGTGLCPRPPPRQRAAERGLQACRHGGAVADHVGARPQPHQALAKAHLSPHGPRGMSSKMASAACQWRALAAASNMALLAMTLPPWPKRKAHHQAPPLAQAEVLRPSGRRPPRRLGRSPPWPTAQRHVLHQGQDPMPMAAAHHCVVA